MIADIGEVIEISTRQIAVNGTVPVWLDAGGRPDGRRSDQRRAARPQAAGGDGVLIAAIVIDRETGELIGGPDLISRGIVDPRQDAILDEARDVLVDALHKVLRPGAELRLPGGQDPRGAQRLHLRADPPPADDPVGGHGGLEGTSPPALSRGEGSTNVSPARVRRGVTRWSSCSRAGGEVSPTSRVLLEVGLIASK